jgi:hypothetical protein
MGGTTRTTRGNGVCIASLQTLRTTCGRCNGRSRCLASLTGAITFFLNVPLRTRDLGNHRARYTPSIVPPYVGAGVCCMPCRPFGCEPPEGQCRFRRPRGGATSHASVHEARQRGFHVAMPAFPITRATIWEIPGRCILVFARGPRISKQSWRPKSSKFTR